MSRLCSAERQRIALVHFRQVVPLLCAATLVGILGLAVPAPWARIVSGTGTVLLSLVLLMSCAQHGMRVSQRSAESDVEADAAPRAEARSFVAVFSAAAVLAFALAALIATRPPAGAASGPFRIVAIVVAGAMLVLGVLLVVGRLRDGEPRSERLADSLTMLLLGGAEALPAVLGILGLVRVGDIGSWAAVGVELVQPTPSVVVGVALMVMLAGGILRLSARVLVRIAWRSADDADAPAPMSSPAAVADAPISWTGALRS